MGQGESECFDVECMVHVLMSDYRENLSWSTKTLRTSLTRTALPTPNLRLGGAMKGCQQA